MVIIWLMMVNNIWLVVQSPAWNIWVRQWERWQSIYEMENKTSSKPPTSHGYVDCMCVDCFDPSKKTSSTVSSNQNLFLVWSDEVPNCCSPNPCALGCPGWILKRNSNPSPNQPLIYQPPKGWLNSTLATLCLHWLRRQRGLIVPETEERIQLSGDGGLAHTHSSNLTMFWSR